MSLIKYKGTDVEKAAYMHDVTDSDIRRWSSGEVTRIGDTAEEENSLISETVFGHLEDEPVKMGHIELPTAVVNINYLYGSDPILPTLTGMKREDLDSLVRRIGVIKTEDEDGNSTLGKDNNDYGLSGADAIEFLLKEKKVPQEMINKIILHCIPVMPIGLRYSDPGCSKGYYKETDLEMLYERILFSINRLMKYQTLEKTPEIVLNTYRADVQLHVNTLISNGACGECLYTNRGWPAESLAELQMAFEGKRIHFPDKEYSFISIENQGPIRPAEILENMKLEKKRMEYFEKDPTRIRTLIATGKSNELPSWFKGETMEDIDLEPAANEIFDTYFGAYATFKELMITESIKGAKAALCPDNYDWLAKGTKEEQKKRLSNLIGSAMAETMLNCSRKQIAFAA